MFEIYFILNVFWFLCLKYVSNQIYEPIKLNYYLFSFRNLEISIETVWDPIKTVLDETKSCCLSFLSTRDRSLNRVRDDAQNQSTYTSQFSSVLPPPDLKKSSRIDPAERSASDDELDKDNKGGLAEDKAMHDLNQLIDSRLAKVPERRLHERLDKRRKDKAAAKLRPFAASGREEESERAHYKRLKKKFAKHGGHRDKKRTKRAEFYDDSSQDSDDLSGRFPREYRAKITSGSSSSESD